MKAQMSYIIKPLSLLMIVLLLVFLYVSINSAIATDKRAKKDLDLRSSATNILLMLSNSKDCVAFKSPVTEGLYANVVDIYKIREFVEKYPNVEPECARSYDFGWVVQIYEVDKDDPNKILSSWSFGANQFEDPNKDNKKGFIGKVEVIMPVALRYSEKDVRVGKMKISLVDGEMERIAGSFDWACQMMKMKRMTALSADIHTSYGISYNEDTNLLCSDAKTPVCKFMSCPIEFTKEINSPGDYTLSIKYSDGKLVIK